MAAASRPSSANDREPPPRVGGSHNPDSMSSEKPESSARPSIRLAGGGLSLVPPDRKYWEAIRVWESDPSESHLWTHRRAILYDEEFARSFEQRLRHYHPWYFVILVGDAPAGFVYAYEIEPNDSAFVTVYTAREHRGTAATIRALARFLHWMFSIQPLRVVWADVFSYNSASISLLETAGFSRSGEIRRARFFQGEYHDLYRYELERAAFYERHTKVLDRDSRRR